jgi:hypothetical protein
MESASRPGMTSKTTSASFHIQDDVEGYCGGCGASKYVNTDKTVRLDREERFERSNRIPVHSCASHSEGGHAHSDR